MPIWEVKRRKRSSNNQTRQDKVYGNSPKIIGNEELNALLAADQCQTHYHWS